MLPNKYESYERKVKVMRKLIVFMLIAMLATNLVGCSGEEKPSNSDTSTNSEEITNEVNDESDDNSNDTSIVEPEVIDAQKDTMKDIIDRMVKTIRTEL